MDDVAQWVPSGIAYMAIGDEFARRLACDPVAGRAVAANAICERLHNAQLRAKAKSYWHHFTLIPGSPLNWPQRAFLHVYPDGVHEERGIGIMPEGFWPTSNTFSPVHWVTGNFNLGMAGNAHFEREGVAFNVEFELSGLPCAETVGSFVVPPAIPGSDQAAPTAREIQRPLNSRPPAVWWPAFAEELAIYMHEFGAPTGQGAEGQSAVIEKIQTRLTEARRPAPTRTQVQSVVTRVLRRMRGEVLDNPINEGE